MLPNEKVARPLSTLWDLKGGVLSSASASGVPIAIVGIGCRFPGGVTTHASFLAMLREGRQAIGDIPADRMDLKRFYDPALRSPGKMSARYGGYLSDIDQFDAEFFGVSPREAERMDPQQRLLLEASWEGLEDAGLDPLRLRGGRVGVYVGQWVSDFEQRLFLHPEELDFTMTLGSGRYALSGRISYLFGFTGPSMTIDTACSSSLVAVHLASQSLRAGESDVAIAGGVNLILGPHIHIAYSQGGMMAPDGQCKFGDARADGYVRSEGVGIVVLKSLEDALHDGDRVHAVIRGSAVNNDGASGGSMGRPSVEGQRAVIAAALADARVDPLEVGYVEAHGTGTPAGDPIEIGALVSALGRQRSPDAPLLVGSVKTNIGHAESAAGIAGLIKATLAVREGEIPASLNFQTPSPLVDWDAAAVAIVRKPRAWTGPSAMRKAGVSGFGISGTNAHVIIEGPPSPTRATGTPTPIVPLLPLSARSEAALRVLAGKVADLLAAPDAPELGDLLRFAQTRRAALEHRAAFLAIDVHRLAVSLKAYSSGGEALAEGVVDPRRKTKVALVFPGQGGQWSGMARALLADERAFRESIERADAVIRREAGWSLIEQLALCPADAGYLGDRIDVVQPTLGALAIAYADWMKAAGLTVELGYWTQHGRSRRRECCRCAFTGRRSTNPVPPQRADARPERRRRHGDGRSPRGGCHRRTGRARTQGFDRRRQQPTFDGHLGGEGMRNGARGPFQRARGIQPSGQRRRRFAQPADGSAFQLLARRPQRDHPACGRYAVRVGPVWTHGLWRRVGCDLLGA